MLWKLGKAGKISVTSTYNALTTNENSQSFKNIWKGKIPAKIKIFLWLAENNAILTKDNLIKCQWKGDPVCCFCPNNETGTLLLFTCCVARIIWSVVATAIGSTDIPKNLKQCWVWFEKWLPGAKKFYALGISAICWAIWKARNRSCFEGKILMKPIEILCHACALMRFWAGLYAEEDEEMLVEGANAMLMIAVKLLCKPRRKASDVLMIKDGNQDEDED